MVASRAVLWVVLTDASMAVSWAASKVEPLVGSLVVVMVASMAVT
jgi:hypothetical protein